MASENGEQKVKWRRRRRRRRVQSLRDAADTSTIFYAFQSSFDY
jgi:hypothetical protein